MTKVSISGGNHQVEVDHDGADLTYIIDKAQRLWDETKPATDRGFGPGFGLSPNGRQQHAGSAVVRS